MSVCWVVPESILNPDLSLWAQTSRSCGYKKMPCGRQCCDRQSRKSFGYNPMEVKKCMKVASPNSPQIPVLYQCMKMERLVEYGVPFQQRGYNAYGMKLGQMAPVAAQCDSGEQACGPLCCDSTEICNPTTFVCTGGAPITPFKLEQTRSDSSASSVFRNVAIGGVCLLGAIVLGIIFYKRKYEPEGGKYSLMLDGVQTRE